MQDAPTAVPVVTVVALPPSISAEMETVSPSSHPSQRPHNCARRGARCSTMWSPYARLKDSRGVEPYTDVPGSNGREWDRESVCVTGV